MAIGSKTNDFMLSVTGSHHGKNKLLTLMRFLNCCMEREVGIIYSTDCANQATVGQKPDKCHTFPPFCVVRWSISRMIYSQTQQLPGSLRHRQKNGSPVKTKLRRRSASNQTI